MLHNTLRVRGNSNHLLQRHHRHASRLVAVRAWKAPFGLGQKQAKKKWVVDLPLEVDFPDNSAVAPVHNTLTYCRSQDPSIELHTDLQEFEGWALKHGLPKQQVWCQSCTPPWSASQFALYITERTSLSWHCSLKYGQSLDKAEACLLWRKYARDNNSCKYLMPCC